MNTISNLNWQPLGQAMLDYFRGELHAHIIIKSNAEQDRAVPLGVFFREGRLPKLEKVALQHCKGKILDAGAGTGAHALKLQNQGKDVTALDISEEACIMMKERGIKNVICGNILEISDTNYDTILLMMNGIGLAGNFDGLDTLFYHLHSILKSGAQVIFDSTDISYLTSEKRMNGTLKIEDTDPYFGIVWYQLEYKGQQGKPYPWLFLDRNKLRKYAIKHKFNYDLLMDHKEQFLVRLIKK